MFAMIDSLVEAGGVPRLSDAGAYCGVRGGLEPGGDGCQCR